MLLVDRKEQGRHTLNGTQNTERLRLLVTSGAVGEQCLDSTSSGQEGKQGGNTERGETAMEARVQRETKHTLCIRGVQMAKPSSSASASFFFHGSFLPSVGIP